MFWSEQLPDGVSGALEKWIKERVAEVQTLWPHVARMNRRRRMWLELSEKITAADPTNAWARQYDSLYLEGQVLALCRVALNKPIKGSHRASLSILLKEFRLHPELLGPIRGPRANGDLLIEPKPDRDRDKMSALLKRILSLRHKVIAHIEVDPKIPDLEWEELDQAVLGVTEIFSIYSRRLTGVRYHVDDEGPQWKTWQQVFSKPLFPAGP